MIFSAVPEPAGFAFLGQEVFADDYLGAAVIFRAQVRRTADGPGRAGLFLLAGQGQARPYLREPLTEQAVLADPGNTFAQVPASSEWSSHEVAAETPAGCDTFLFGISLSGPGRIELRNPELARLPAHHLAVIPARRTRPARPGHPAPAQLEPFQAAFRPVVHRDTPTEGK